MRRLLLVLALLLALPLPARAQVAVDLQASLPLGEQARVNRPLAVACILSNRGEATTVRLEARSEPYGDVATRELGVADVDLPAGARQRVDLLIPRFEGGGHVQVRLLHRGQELVQRRLSVSPVWDDSRRIVAVLSPERGSFAYLAAYAPTANSEQTLVRPDPSLFPETAAALSGIDVVVVHDLPALGLSNAAQQALADWCRTWGTLAFVSSLDPQEYRGSPLEPLLPLNPAGTVPAGGLTLLMGASAGDEIQALEGAPLVLAAGRVGGVAAMLTTPLATSDLLGSQRTEEVWRSLDAYAHAVRSDFPSLPAEAPVLDRPPELQPPDMGMIVWFLLAYVVLVGPVNFLILRRRDRMLLVFLTVPALAGLFAAVAFTGGYAVRGGNLLFLEVGQLGLRSGESTARWQGAVALYSPRPDEYEVSLPRSARFMENRLNHQDARPVTAVLDRRILLRDLEMRMWSMRRFRTAGPVALEGPLEVTSTGAANRSNLALTYCRIVEGERMSEPFDLPPGSTREATPDQPWSMPSDPLWDNLRSQPRGRVLVGFTVASLSGWRVEGDPAEARCQTMVVVEAP